MVHSELGPHLDNLRQPCYPDRKQNKKKPFGMKHCSVQLFSTRHTPLELALHQIADFGFKHVEGYEALYASPQEMKARLDHFGLSLSRLLERAMEFTRTFALESPGQPGS